MIGLLPPKEGVEAQECIKSHILGVPNEILFNTYGKKWGFRTAKSFADSLRDTWGLPIAVPPSAKHRWDDGPRLYGDVLTLCDAQVPFHDAESMNDYLSLAMLGESLKAYTPGIS